MKRLLFLLLFFICTFQLSAQEKIKPKDIKTSLKQIDKSSYQVAEGNREINNLYEELQEAENKVQRLKAQIQNEIRENGYLLKIEIEEHIYGGVELLNKPYSYSIDDILDTIKNGNVVKIIDQDSKNYIVEFNGHKGYLSKFGLKPPPFTPLSYLQTKEERVASSFLKPSYNKNDSKSKKRKSTLFGGGGSTSSKSKTKKRLDYSKPIRVRGHYRTTKSGKRVYVRPHTRSRRK